MRFLPVISVEVGGVSDGANLKGPWRRKVAQLKARELLKALEPLAESV